MRNFVQDVKSRRSVRSFNGEMPDKKVMDDLRAFAEEITNPYGVKVRFVFLDAQENKLSSPVISGEKCYVSAVVKKGEHAEEAYGYSFQKLLMHAHELGLGTVWIGGTMPRDKFEAATGLEDGEVMPCVSPIGAAASKMSVKETLMRKGVKADSRLKYEELFFAGNFGTPLTEGSAMERGIYSDLEVVRLAPSAVNKQPWRVVVDGNRAHFYVKHDKGFTTPDYDLQKIDLGIAIYNYETQLKEEGRKPVVLVDDPKIFAPDGIDYVATIAY